MNFRRKAVITELQPIAELDQAAPVQNTWYTIAELYGNLLIYSAKFRVTDTGETLEPLASIDDDDTLSTSLGANANTWYAVYLSPSAALWTNTSMFAFAYYNPLKCKSFKFQMRKTTAAGAGSLQAKIVYGVLSKKLGRMSWPRFRIYANLSQAAPVQNTWYTIADIKGQVEAYYAKCSVATTGETLEVKATINGRTLTASAWAAGAGSTYYIRIDEDGELTVSASISNVVGYSPLNCRGLKLEVRKTTNNGAGTLSGAVIHSSV